MFEIPRHLITSADERTWKFDRPVIFLGEWCRLYARNDVWKDMDAIVAAPYGLGVEQKDADNSVARALEEQLFPILCAILNQHHGTAHSDRFWKIVLGHWLRRIIDVTLNRVRTLEQCLRAHQLSGTTAISGDHYSLAPLNSYAAIRAFNDDRWNNTLYIRILSLLGETSIPMEAIAQNESDGFRWTAMSTKVPLRKRILKWGYEKTGKLTGLLARAEDVFIINSYLPKKEEIKLQLALGQMPQLWTSPQLANASKPDHALRQSLSASMPSGMTDTLHRIVYSLVFELLPVCYLEGFADLSEKVKCLSWPKTPKLIFTSNNFDTDEVFKLWAATRINSGSTYVAAQHGSNYGTSRYMSPSVEEATADKFLTWGWTDGLPQHTPALILKTAGRKSETYDPSGGLLLVELHAGIALQTWDVYAEFHSYFEDQKRFIEKLDMQPREQLTVRLHHEHANLKWGEVDRWRMFDRSIKLDTGSSSMSTLIAQNRLVIHSYDSSGVLEMLSQNIPMLAFWQDNFDHLRDSAKPYYQLLVGVGIVHLTPESVAEKVNEIWNDVGSWWMQPLVQEARKRFCDRYARVSQEPVSDLKRILIK